MERIGDPLGYAARSLLRSILNKWFSDPITTACLLASEPEALLQLASRDFHSDLRLWLSEMRGQGALVRGTAQESVLLTTMTADTEGSNLDEAQFVPVVTQPASDETPGFESLAYSRPFGQGEMPTELERFNWAAFFFPWLWAIAFRVWWVFGIFFLALLCDIFLKAVDSTSGSIMRLVYDLMLAVFSLWLGVCGHPLAWQASMRRQRQGNSEWMTVGSVLKGQRKWILFGVGITVVEFFLTFIPMTDAVYRASLGVEAIISSIIFLAELAVAVHLSRSQQWLWRTSTKLRASRLSR